MSLCHDCIHRALRSINGFALWGCLKRKIRFGIAEPDLANEKGVCRLC